MFKKCKVVMLPTKEKANIVLKKNKELILLPTGHIGTNPTKLTQPQHLYITSDDRIKNGDWVIVGKKLVKVTLRDGSLGYDSFDEVAFLFIQHHHKKIIATTNILPEYKAGIEVDSFLPKPSQSFIEKYVEEYNKGQQITVVLVEYDGDWDEHYQGYYAETVIPKVSKDNTITIKEVKDSWSREEHIEGMWEAYKASNTTFEDEDALKQEFNNWIENLKL